MRIVSIMWNAYVGILKKAADKIDFIDLEVFSSKYLEKEKERIGPALKKMSNADLILLFKSSEEFWLEIEDRIKEFGKRIPVVCVAYDPSNWGLTNTSYDIPAKCYEYIVYGGEENFRNMLLFLSNRIFKLDCSYEPPKKLPWEGIYHPRAERHFEDIDSYLEWYNPKDAPTIGILFSRHYYVNDNLDVERSIIDEVEGRGMNVIPVFSYSLRDENLGARGSGWAVRNFFIREGRAIIDALIKLQTFFLGSTREKDRSDVSTSGVEILKDLDVPVFQPITSYHKTVKEWEEDNQGLGLDVSWNVAMPEFEGVIEPIMVGGPEKVGDMEEKRVPIEERVKRLVDRVEGWVRLRRKPPSERKVVFVLHNNPCASVEATVGAGAHLDTLESVVRIMKRMKEVGYVVDPPRDGKELIDTIMGKKAISEFRWTTVDEIVKKGGAIALIPLDKYLKWWNEFPERVRDRISSSWGNPPGEEMNGVPAAMVYDGKIVVTGVSYGNVIVAVQPKRGCAGPRCDGRVCKILHDPDVPPPHQYIATYRYFEEEFGADCIIHVGTHGNLEFLPGKGVGLSSSCFPDLSIHKVPHLYIYNADNPPEGVIAKRRSYAALVDHMQTVMVEGGLYEGLEELEMLLEEYEKAKSTDRGRAHMLEHMILDKVKEVNLGSEIGLKENAPFQEIARKIHESLSRIRNTHIQDGMHIFGDIPQGERLVDFICAIMRFDTDGRSLRKTIASLMGLELSDLLRNQGDINPLFGVSCGKLLEEIDRMMKGIIKRILSGEDDLEGIFQSVLGERLVRREFLKDISWVRDRVLDLKRRIEESKEIDALLHGLSGRYILPGPSGLITRGRDDVLPTGRNFYSLDPERVPTKAAYKVGEKLAHALIEKFLEEEGRYPENVAIYWMANDIMWSDGEGMGKILSLIGVRPLWLPNGKVKGFEVIPLSELKRPRIDVTIRVSGITRDNFINCVELVDEAIQKVASLDEPLDMNYVRKHTLEKLKENGGNVRDATLRIFASKPGTYSSGVNLAVYASAWKDEKDLADIFVYWNSYAYGKGVFGKEAVSELVSSLKTVDVTFNKVVSDEYDLFGCCCYFGTHGGITVAARNLSKKDVKSYYGDTRESEHVEVRTLADEIRRVVRTKLLNPRWIEGMKRHGYKGAGDISKRVGRVFGWQATTREVDDWIFNDIAKTFVLNEENRKFFEENNPWALEEIGRRLLEAAERGLWNADPDILNELKDIYFSEIEGWIEDRMGDVEGDFQGGAIDILTSEDVDDWGRMMGEVRKKLEGIRG